MAANGSEGGSGPGDEWNVTTAGRGGGHVPADRGGASCDASTASGSSGGGVSGAEAEPSLLASLRDGTKSSQVKPSQVKVSQETSSLQDGEMAKSVVHGAPADGTADGDARPSKARKRQR